MDVVVVSTWLPFVQTTPAPSYPAQSSLVKCRQSCSVRSVPTHRTSSRAKLSGTLPKWEKLVALPAENPSCLKWKAVEVPKVICYYIRIPADNNSIPVIPHIITHWPIQSQGVVGEDIASRGVTTNKLNLYTFKKHLLSFHLNYFQLLIIHSRFGLITYH